jgi:hypothetical protein
LWYVSYNGLSFFILGFVLTHANHILKLTDLFLRSFGLTTLKELPPLEAEQHHQTVLFSEFEKK